MRVYRPCLVTQTHLLSPPTHTRTYTRADLGADAGDDSTGSEHGDVLEILHDLARRLPRATCVVYKRRTLHTPHKNKYGGSKRHVHGH